MIRHLFSKQLEKEQFEKLPQLDRIEFRQKLYSLEKDEPTNMTFSFINSMLLIIGFVLLLAMQFYDINIETFIRLFNVITVLIKVTLYMALALGIIYIVQLIIYIKQRRTLFAEYFELKLDNKKKK